MKKRPSSEDVALRAGVSRATVSAYLNRSRYVSPELQMKIEQAIKELNYIPDPLARALKMNDAKTIGLIIPIVSNFYNPMIRVVNECAHQKSYSFLLASSEEDPNREKEILRVFLAKRISGILVVPCSDQNQTYLYQIHQSGIPMIQVNRKITDLDIDSVVSDNFQAAYKATRHLIERGRQKIALFGYDSGSLANYEKKNGYDRAIKEQGLPDLTIHLKEHNVDNFVEEFNLKNSRFKIVKDKLMFADRKPLDTFSTDSGLTLSDFNEVEVFEKLLDQEGIFDREDLISGFNQLLEIVHSTEKQD